MFSLTLSRILLATVVLLSACGRTTSSPTGPATPTVGESDAPLEVTCPLGAGRCLWPSTDAAPFIVEDAPLARREVAVSWTMAGSASLVTVQFAATRSTSSAGALVVELRADAPSPAAGTLLATGRLDLSGLCVTGDAGCTADADASRVALAATTGASGLVDGKRYWLRVRGDRGPDASLKVALGAVGDGLPAAGTARTVTAATSRPTATSPFPSTTYVSTVDGSDLAFLPMLAPAAVTSCLDGRRGVDEADIDCGVACGAGCAKGRLCRGSADCADGLFCQPAAPGAGEEACVDAVCVCTSKRVAGAACRSARECAGGRCTAGVDGTSRCEASTCLDGMKNGGEADVDCGGTCAERCGATRTCSKDGDCANGLFCQASRCLSKTVDGAACKADAQCRSGLCLLGRSPAVCGSPLPAPDACSRAAECASGVCRMNRCATPTGSDRVRNGDESGADCGGSASVRCPMKEGCRVDGDCVAGFVCSPGGRCLRPASASCAAATDCASGLCGTTGRVRTCRAAPACDDGLADGSETDVDCGGTCAAAGRRCGGSKKCVRGADCASGVCTAAGTCAATSCSDGVVDGEETGLDCGGTCSPCAAGVSSIDAAGCASRVLGEDGRCAEPACDDGVVNGTETDTDPATGRECGGGCAPCPRGGACLKAGDCRIGSCGTTRRCSTPANQPAGNGCEFDGDCASGLSCLCDGAVCAAGLVGRCASKSLCANRLKDAAEVDVDCGRVCARGCGDSRTCRAADDCSSGVCTSGKCAAPTAKDRVRNGTETAVDCGGSSGTLCLNGLRCLLDGDCASGTCDAALGTCQPADGPCGNGPGLSCGRSCTRRCAGGVGCRADIDCASLQCEGGACVPAGCVIDGRRYVDGARNPDQPCQSCSVAVSTSAWSPAAEGTQCDDGDGDTTSDLCASAVCVGTPNPCLAEDLTCGRAVAVAEGLSCRADTDCPAGERGAQTCVAGRCRGVLCRLSPKAGTSALVCRPAAGACDLPEHCSPTSPECPPDLLVAAQTTCRPSTASCDAAERCDGVHAACPVDRLAPAGATCRPSAVPCDASEVCDGVSLDCPVDRPMVSGDACVSPATGPGVCVGSDALTCSPTASCVIGGVRWREQERDATGCRVCLPARRLSAWSFLPDGTTCPGGTCDGGGTCEPSCDASPCPALAPRVDAVASEVVHARLDTDILIRGSRLAGAQASLVSGTRRVGLGQPLSRDNLLRVTVPAGLEPGAWDLELTGTEGISTRSTAVRVTNESLTVDVLDVGQGDASLIRAPSGRTMLIDGGIFGMGLSRVDPRLTAPPDYVVVTHFDADHLAGVYEVLAGPDQLPNTADDVDPVVALLDHGDNHACGSQLCERYLTLRGRLESEGKARALTPGDRVDLGAGATATCVFVNGRTADGGRVFTASENENSVGLLLEFAGFRYYSGGDVTGGVIEGCNASASGGFEDVEGAAARFIGQVDAMKVSHHGSCTATTASFAGVLLPQVTLTSAGLDNSYCHPADRVLANFDHLGVDMLLTAPGMLTAGKNGCSPTVRPPRVAPVYGTLSLAVPGDGTFSASAFDGTTTWQRSYTARLPRLSQESDPTAWPMPDGVRFVGVRGRQPVSGPLAVDLPRVPPTDRAWLVPWALVDDALLQDITRSRPVPGALSATVTHLGQRLTVTPATGLEARTAYALVLPRTTLGTTSPAVLPFLTGVDTATGPSATLVSSVADAMNLSEVVVRFDRPVTGVSSASFFLEERLTGSDVVYGSIRAESDGRT
ncbi:MAG: hypothetical protein RL199_1458, partial [Pseudomonadota bacterium]